MLSQGFNRMCDRHWKALKRWRSTCIESFCFKTESKYCVVRSQTVYYYSVNMLSQSCAKFPSPIFRRISRFASISFWSDFDPLSTILPPLPNFCTTILFVGRERQDDIVCVACVSFLAASCNNTIIIIFYCANDIYYYKQLQQAWNCYY